MPRFAPHGYIHTVVPLLRTQAAASVNVDVFTNPLAAVENQYVVSANMGNKTYTLANSGLPGDGYAHLVTIKRTFADTADTPGVMTFSGLDNNGATITNVLTPSGSDATEVVGTKAFKSVVTIVGSGWTKGGTTEDTIVCGFKSMTGLNAAAAAAGDVLTVFDHTSKVLTASFAASADGTLPGTFFTPTGANGTLDFDVVYTPVQSTALTANTAATLLTTAALGYEAEVEEFGVLVDVVLAGTGGTLTFTLRDSADNVIATLTPTLALGAVATTISTTTMSAYAGLRDASTLVIKRTATGTVFTSGSVTFYVKLRQRTQRN